MNLLLSSDNTTTIVALIVVGTIFLIAGIIIYGLKRDGKRTRKMLTKNEPQTVNVELKPVYMKESETLFLKTLNNVLPSEFVAYPKVAFSNIMQPKNDKILYNAILSECCDMCVFLKKTMQPIMVVDLFESSPVEQQMKQLNPNVIKALQTVKLPVLTIQVSEEYDLTELRSKVIDTMPTKMIAFLKDNLKKQ